MTATVYSDESNSIVETLLNLVEKVEEIERQQQDILRETRVLEDHFNDNRITTARVTHDAESLLCSRYDSSNNNRKNAGKERDWQLESGSFSACQL